MKVSEGYTIADSGNLPRVDYVTFLQYINENDCFNVAELRSAKTLLASREAYVETAVGYVEIKRDGHECTVKGRVTPEHKVKSKLYHVSARIDESANKIIKVECNDCAASAGGCKHAICFVMWLNKKTVEPSVTSVSCYWNKPKLAEAVGCQNYILAKDIGKKRKVVPENISMDVTLSMFSEECERRNLTTALILKYCGIHKTELDDFRIFNLMLQFVNETSDHCYDHFKEFCDLKLTVDIVDKIAEATQSQADSKLWHSMRQGRVTGSRIYEAIHCKTENGVLVRSILGGYKVPETKAIQRGKALGKQVLKELEKDYGIAQTTGIILISPIFGASPDGLFNNFVVEIKCPTSTKTMKNYIKDSQLQEKYKAQIMIQMHGAKRNKGLFCVADPSYEETKVIHKYWVEYDYEYVNDLLCDAEEFWKKYIFNTILDNAK